MSRVFVAEETALGRKVVLKLLPPELAAGLNIDRFRREIQLAASLQHPHIVPLYAAGQAAELLYFTMPLVEGESLRAKLAREGEQPVGETVRVLKDLVDALAYAHGRGLVHRDIKPDNILIAHHHAVVTDFGVAKALSESTGRNALTSAGVALGTPAYMAPEQASADPHTDHRADLYAVGAVAYEMLTGRPPFTGPTPQAVLAAHVTKGVEPLGELRPSVPPALQALVMRCLEKKPADRWQRAEELLHQLEAMATPSGGMAPTAPVEAVRRSGWSGRTRVAAGAAVLLAAGTGALLVLGRDRPRVAPSAAVMAVMPFTPAAPDTALARLGRDLVVTLSANLDGVGEIRTVDALTVLAQVKASAEAPSLSQAAAGAMRLGARSVLQGTLVRVGDLIRVDVGLYTADSATPIARATTTAGLHDVTILTDSITWAILRQVWRSRGAPTPSLGAITTHSVSALRAFLEGERAITEGKFRRAEEAFGRALEADSTFWLAYRRYEFARSWGFRSVDSVFIARYRSNRDKLPERERLLIEATLPDSLGERLARLRTLTKRYPDFWFAWWDYADELTHRGGFLGHPWAEAKSALQHVVTLNPDLVSAWDHLLWVGIHTRDSAVTRRVLSENARVHIDSTWIDAGNHYYTVLRLAAYEFLAPDSAAALLDSLVSPAGSNDWDEEIGSSLAYYGFPRAQLDYSHRVLRRVRDSGSQARHLAFVSIASAARGAWDSAMVAADALFDRGPAAGPWQPALFRFRQATVAAWLGALDPAEAQRRKPVAAQGGPSEVAELAWLDGVLAYARGDRAGLIGAREAVRDAKAAASSDLDRSLAAFELDLEGKRQPAAIQLGALERERAQLLRDRSEHPALAGINRLAASRWLATAGDTAQALSLLRWPQTVHAPEYEWIAQNIPFTAIALLEEARLLEGQSRLSEARSAYERFLQWYDLPAPAHKHLVAEANDALARLAGRHDQSVTSASEAPR